MSLIYKSLQQLKKEEEKKKIRPRLQSPQAVSSGMRTIIVRASVILLVAGILAWGATSWIRSELRHIMLVNAQQTSELVRGEQNTPEPVEQPEPVLESEPVRDMTNELPDITTVAVAQPAPRVVVPKVIPDSPRRIDAPEKAPQAEQTEKLSALQTHFATQARKNQHLLKVSNDLKRAKATPEGTQHLQAFNRELGAENIFSTKWQGYTALKNKEYAKAESLYKRVLQTHEDDRESQINLILALLGQKKDKEARARYNRYIQDFPTDQSVRQLAQVFD
jgi:hypothetical protein